MPTKAGEQKLRPMYFEEASEFLNRELKASKSYDTHVISALNALRHEFDRLDLELEDNHISEDEFKALSVHYGTVVQDHWDVRCTDWGGLEKATNNIIPYVRFMNFIDNYYRGRK